MSIFEYNKQKIEAAWKETTQATHDFDKAKTVQDLVNLRELVQHRLSAFDVTCRSIFASNRELKEFQLPVKDGFVTYESACKSWGWKIVEWLMELQRIIDERCAASECSHGHLFGYVERQSLKSAIAVDTIPPRLKKNAVSL